MEKLFDDKLKLNIQFFADGGDNADETPPEDTGNDNNDDNVIPEDEKPTITPKQMRERLEREREKLKKEAAAEVEEAKKLAKMNKEQRDEHERQKAEQERQELLDKVARYEMRNEATNMLVEKGLPVNDDVLNVLVTASADETKQRIDLFAGIVESTVNDKLKDYVNTGTPKNQPKGIATALTKQDILNVRDPKEQQRLIAENPQLFNY